MDSYLKMKFLKNAREKSGQFIDLYRVDECYCISDTVEKNEVKNRPKTTTTALYSKVVVFIFAYFYNLIIHCINSFAKD